MYLIKRFRNGGNREYQPKVQLSHIRDTGEIEHAQVLNSASHGEGSRFSKLGRLNQYLRFNDDDEKVDFRGSGNLTLDDISGQY